MKQYHDLIRHILKNGVQKDDRTGTGTLSVFGYQMRFDLGNGFPLLTTKKLHLKSIIHELLWFISGSTNTKYLQEHSVRIWDEWADENCDLGPIYGKQWRSWPNPVDVLDENSNFVAVSCETIDQIAVLIDGIRSNPNGRRHIVSAWNVAQIDKMALPPCHLLFQCYVANDKLSLQIYQRSADVFLGVPFNIASYALLTMMLAQVCSLEPGELIWTGGDCHLYGNHIEQAKQQLTRQPFDLPTMYLNPYVEDIDGFTFADFSLANYECHPHIKAEVSV